MGLLSVGLMGLSDDNDRWAVHAVITPLLVLAALYGSIVIAGPSY